MSCNYYQQQVKSLETFRESYLQNYGTLINNGRVDDDLKRFHIRSSVIFGARIEIDDDVLSEKEKEAQVFTLRLSEAWFAYEALIPCFDRYQCKKTKTIVTKHPKSVASIQDALRQPINQYDKDPPYGKACFFNYDFTSDWNMTSLIQDEIDLFLDYVHSFIPIGKSREFFHKYLEYLEEHATGEQRRFLLDAHNAINNKSGVDASSVLCISYAIRNQYVHNGEIIDSEREDPYIKCELLKACYNFTMSNSFAIADAIIDSVLQMPVTDT